MKTKDQIDNIVKETYRHIDFSGVILVKEKSIVYEEAFGYANRNECINNTLQTRFELPLGVKYSQLSVSVNLLKMG